MSGLRATVGKGLAHWREHCLTVDLRALAAFRVAFALVLLADVALRLGDIAAFYGDAGTLPRTALLATHFGERFSLALAAGSPLWAGLLFGLCGLAALALLVGWRTRSATLLLFVLLGSLQSRNPFVLIGADIQIMVLLFWMLFLPVAARWSVDAAVSATPPPEHPRWRGVAALAILVQVVSVYFFSAVLKDGSAWWPDATAVYYALELDRYTTDIGRWLQQFSGLTTLLTGYVWLLEWLAPLLVLAPWFSQALRAAAMLLLMLMHVGFALCLELGPFPYTSLAALLVLAPPALMDRIGAALGVGRHAPRIYFDGDCAFCRAGCRLLRVFLILPRARIAPAQDSVRAHRLMQAHWSWVVIDDSDTAHLKHDAFLALLRASPLFGWAAPPLGLAPVRRLGDRLYDRIANGRGRVAAASGWLWHERPLRWQPGRASSALAGAFLLTVTLWNAGTVGWINPALLQPVAPVLATLRIDQRWDMFAPEPSRLDGWLVFPGTREDGRDIDVRRRAPLDWQRPDPPHGQTSVRWHSYEWRLLALREEALFNAYGRYLCRRYNRAAEPGARLLAFDMVYVIRRTPAPGESSRPQRQTAWRHQCLADSPS